MDEGSVGLYGYGFKFGGKRVRKGDHEVFPNANDCNNISS